MNPYYFLASPYNGSAEEKIYRHHQCQKMVTYFLEHNISIFAPILYNQALLESNSTITLEQRRKLLMPMNIDFLSNAAGALILKIEGWDTSWGLGQYLEVFRKKDIAVFDLVPAEIEKTRHAIQAKTNFKLYSHEIRKFLCD